MRWRCRPLRAVWSFRNVRFCYEADGSRPILSEINLRVEPGELIGLVGPSGSGKTTLVNLLMRFYDPTEGAITVDGVNLRQVEMQALRRQIGCVSQEPFLFSGTIAENIAYGRPEASLAQIIEAAMAANAHDFILGFPDAYDTEVGERGVKLSGGEKQRISIARAMLNNPRILILDEATSAVDTETESLIQEAMDRLMQGRTTFAIAHRLSTLKSASRLVVIEKGKIVEVGTHQGADAPAGRALRPAGEHPVGHAARHGGLSRCTTSPFTSGRSPVESLPWSSKESRRSG